MNNTTSSLEQPSVLDESVATNIAEPTEATEPSLATEITEEISLDETATEEAIVASAEIPDNGIIDETVEEPIEATVEETTDSAEPLLETPSVEETVDMMTAEDATADAPETDSNNVVDQIGQLTRTLHDSLRELGYDKRLEDISAEVPEAQDKLTYIATKAEQAAERVLNATEIAMPIQEELSTASTNLSEQWKQALESQESSPDDAEKYKNLIINTLTYLDSVPKQADATNAQLMEIMMAQDFQDLTGQVVSKVTKMVKDLEFELLQLLVANVPEDKRVGIDEGLMNGPVVNPEKRDDVVSNQEQVDDLLASMGF